MPVRELEIEGRELTWWLARSLLAPEWAQEYFVRLSKKPKLLVTLMLQVPLLEIALRT